MSNELCSTLRNSFYLMKCPGRKSMEWFYHGFLAFPCYSHAFLFYKSTGKAWYHIILKPTYGKSKEKHGIIMKSKNEI